MLKLFSSPGRTGGLFPRLKAPIKKNAKVLPWRSFAYCGGLQLLQGS